VEVDNLLVETAAVLVLVPLQQMSWLLVKMMQMVLPQ
jgi:hypothetical protein